LLSEGVAEKPAARMCEDFGARGRLPPPNKKIGDII